MRLLVHVLLAAFCGCDNGAVKPAPDEALINAIGTVESHNDDRAVGDTNLKNPAYGWLQIRQPCVDDVKDHIGLSELKASDCLGDRELSKKIFRAYMARWATEKRLGREPTDEDRARIWNGGPNGWKKDATASYWRRVRKALEKAPKK